MTGAAARVAVLAPAAVLAAQFTAVRPTNFSGWDEWLLISLGARGLVSVPYANRPLVLMWAVPGAWTLPHDLLGFYLAHAAYLAMAAVLTAWLAARLLPGAPLAALGAGACAAAWAPLDDMRLDTVLLTGYSGFTAASMAAIVLFLEGWRRGRALLALLGAALGVVTVLGFEGTLPLLAAAPALPLLAGHVPRDAGQRRRFLKWAAAWEAALAAAAVPLLLSLALPRAASYQGALGLDAHPVRMALRMLRQYRLALEPLATSAPRELLHPAVALAVLVFAAAAVVVARGGGSDEGASPDSRRRPLRLVAAGLLLASMGWLALSASPSVRGAARAQILCAPGLGLLLAGTVAVLSAGLRTRLRHLVLAAAAAWVVAVGTGRVAAMQRQWDAGSYWPAQRRVLAQLTAAAPALRPNTLVVLLDETRAFPATFTFHHALAHLYGEGVVGQVRGGEEFLYPARFGAAGVAVEPWPVIRKAWRSPPTLHRYDEVLLAYVAADGGLQLLSSWPSVLPPLPEGATYAPSSRVVAGPPRSQQRILDRAR